LTAATASLRHGSISGPDGALTDFISGSSGTFAGITSAFSYNKRVNMSASAPSQTIYSIGYDFHAGNGTIGADSGNVFGIYNYKDRDRDQTFTYDLDKQKQQFEKNQLAEAKKNMGLPTLAWM
jgi:hypothetical protein